MPPKTTPAGPARAIPVPTLLTLALVSAIAPLATDMYLPGLPQVGVDLAADDALVQLTLMTFMLGLAAGQLAIGPLSDGLGRRRPLLAGTVLLAAAGLACALAPSITVLVVARFLQGFTGGIGVVLARAVIADRTSGDRAARLFSIMMIITGVAPVVAPLLGGALVGPIGWRGVFYVLTGLAVLMLLCAWRFVPESLPAARRHPVEPRAVGRSIGAVLATRVYLGYAATFAAAFGALFGYISASPFILQGIMGFSPGVFSVLFALNAVGLTGANAVNSRLIGRFRPHTLLSFGVGSLVAVSVAMLAVVLADFDARWPLLTVMFLLTCSIGFIFGNATGLALDAVRTRAGTGSAVLGALQFTVGAVAAPVVGLGGGASAVPMAITVAVSACCSAVAFSTTAAGRGRRRAPARG
ncbi:multidrug effflux MFS transporter [Tomitella gaofuii]|uniref:multidrug effflux MFS transporter n=1 Tax=Tomitella gaofuii TaxID=2760083 RepID=UPI0020BDBE2D|nr:multidrug effflux MFS transporter [Tomitella gaofuii]